MPPPVPPLAAGAPVGATPGLELLWRAALRCWLALALPSVLIGLAWRCTGAAPELALALDGAGLALWLCAWPLAAALAEVRVHQERHGGRPAWRWRCRITTALHLWLAAVCLALAPAGLLLAYDGQALLLLLQTVDPFTFALTTFIVGAGVLALLGPAVLVSATVLLAALHRYLGQWAGSLAWAMLALLAHLPLLAGTEAWLASRLSLRLTPLGAPVALSLPHEPPLATVPLGLSIGQYAQDMLRFCQQSTLDVGRYAFMEDLLRRIPLWPVLALLAALLVWLGLSALPQRGVSLRPTAVWPAALSLLTVVLMQLALTAQWQAQPELRFPVPPAGVFTTGLAALWLGYALCLNLAKGRPRLGLASVGWTVLASAGWLALTLPQVAAGQASTGQLLVLAGIAAALGLAGQAVLARLTLLFPGRLGDWIAIAGALALTLPLVPAGSLGVQLLGMLSTGWTDPDQVESLALLAACGIGVAVASWPWPALRRIDHSVARMR